MKAKWDFEPPDDTASRSIAPAGILRLKAFCRAGAAVAVLCVRKPTFYKLPCDSDLMVIIVGVVAGGGGEGRRVPPVKKSGGRPPEIVILKKIF